MLILFIVIICEFNFYTLVQFIPSFLFFFFLFFLLFCSILSNNETPMAPIFYKQNKYNLSSHASIYVFMDLTYSLILVFVAVIYIVTCVFWRCLRLRFVVVARLRREQHS